MSRVTMLIGVSFLMVGLYIDSWMVFCASFFWIIVSFIFFTLDIVNTFLKGAAEIAKAFLTKR